MNPIQHITRPPTLANLEIAHLERGGSHTEIAKEADYQTWYENIKWEDEDH